MEQELSQEESQTNQAEETDTNTNKEQELPSVKKSGFFWETVRFSIIAIIIVVPFRLFVAQPFIVNGSSMDPTFATGQYLIVDELTYHFEKPKRGDVIVFGFPQDRKKFFIKRIIGLPGETVEITGTKVKITNSQHPDGFILEEPYLIQNSHWLGDNLSVSLTDSEYFVMGDNRRVSYDSRMWGPLEERLIVGRAFLRLFPLDTIAFKPGM
jgi:signal peptidase I